MIMNKEQQIIEWFNKNTNSISKETLFYLFPYIELSIKDMFLIFINFINNVELCKKCFINIKCIEIICIISLTFDCYYRKSFNNFFQELKETLIKKNRDYGNSFDRSINKFGWIYLSIELDEKKNRLHNLLKSKSEPNYESIEGTLLDIAGYCVLALIYIENNKD